MQRLQIIVFQTDIKIRFQQLEIFFKPFNTLIMVRDVLYKWTQSIFKFHKDFVCASLVLQTKSLMPNEDARERLYLHINDLDSSWQEEFIEKRECENPSKYFYHILSQYHY